MESKPSSGPETPVPLTRRAASAAATRLALRSRRVQTFGLGALCGALALSLVIVLTTIVAVAQRPDVVPRDPAPVSGERLPTPAPATPTPSPTATRAPTAAPEEQADAAPDADPAPPVAQDPPPAPAPAPEPTPSDTAPGNSGNAPGRTKKP